MAFSHILGQDPAIALLKKAIQQQRLPSAYLFTGPAHIGKYKTVLSLTQTINCIQQGDDACLCCDACLQITHQNFPDFFVIKPEGQFIKISQIKESLKWLHLRPAYGKYRILAIEGAEKMNKESANAFLKTLEEPPSQTLIILLAETPQQLLETIVSRCQIIRFQLLQKKYVEQILKEYPKLSPAQLEFLTGFSMGCIREDWIEKIDALQAMRDQVIDLLVTLSSGQMGKIFNVIEGWSSSKDKEWRYMLDFLEYWFRDLAWVWYGLPPQQVFNQGRMEQLQQCVPHFPLDCVLKNYQKILQTREQIRMNAYVPLALDALWLHFKQNLVM
ncbi:MAG: DNA polymerase III subunit delta' [SAR324 cluster bacterium]|nr:DNA polymerase III subunit delta' [SAR324 cluster bacterium]